MPLISMAWGGTLGTTPTGEPPRIAFNLPALSDPESGVISYKYKVTLQPELTYSTAGWTTFNPAGSTYTAEFKRKYYEAQAARMNRLIAAAAAQAGQLGTDRGPFPDDNVFLIVRAQGARLADAETIADTATVKPRKLLRNNGSTVTQIVRSVRPDVRPNPAQNAAFDGGARLLTIKSFLTANAIRSAQAMTGVDWCSSNNSTPCALAQIGVPLLVSAMGGNTGLRDNESLYETAASRDKDFFVLEGATHNIDPCVECETRKGEYGNSARNFFNYVRDWMNARFAR